MILWPQGGLWRHADFLKLWGAQAVSAVGNRVTRTTLPILAVVLVGGSPFEMGVLAALGMAPGALVALFLGGFVDRSAKRPVLIACDLMRAALLATIPLTAWVAEPSMPQLYAVATLAGAASALFQITDNAYLPTLVEDDQLVSGNAKLEGTDAVAEIAGPGLAGVLIQWLTAPLALAFDALTFLVSAALLSLIQRRESPAASGGPRPHPLADLNVGLKAILGTPLVKPLLLASAITTLSWGFFSALYTLLVIDVMQVDPKTFGLIISVGGVSALVGSAWAGRVTRALGLGKAMLVCAAAGQVVALCVPAAAWAHDHATTALLPLALLVAAQLFGDGFAVAYEVLAVSLRQAALPRAALARANGVFVAVQGLLLPPSALLAGVIAEALGVETAIWLGMGVGVLAPLCLLPLAGVQSITEAQVNRPHDGVTL